MAEEVKAKYKCTQQELYGILELAINNMEEDLPLFTAKSDNYNPALVLAVRGVLGAAVALPNEEQRNGVHQTLKGLLPGLMEPVKQDFRDLQGYIRDGWPNENPKPRYEQAGLIDFNKIGNDNWEHVKGLNDSMRAFITDAVNGPILLLPGGMIATFVADQALHYAAFKAKYDLFLLSKETSVARAAKIKADNTAHTACMKFMTFGADSVMRNSAEGQKRYTFITLKHSISPPGSASLIVKVKNADDTLVTNGTVTIKEEGQPAKTVNINADGEAFFPNINPADYTGFVTVNAVNTNFIKEVNTGTAARLKVVVG